MDEPSAGIGFDAEEIDTSAPTRAARLKWVIVVNDSIPAGRAANAAVCVAGATLKGVRGLLGPAAVDQDGFSHPGLPWAGCSVLTANDETIRIVRQKAAAHEEIFVADMPDAAQSTRVYDDYLSTIASSDPNEIEYLAVSLVGPKNRIDRIVGKLPLLP
jgi:hypothetical protein